MSHSGRLKFRIGCPSNWRNHIRALPQEITVDHMPVLLDR